MNEQNHRDSLERLATSSIEFLGEQDGESERILKHIISPILKNYQSVKSAYLARIKLQGYQQTMVALCIRMNNPAREQLARRLSIVFSKTFSQHEHLDIVFLTDDQELALEKVCSPFYNLGLTNNT
jgi:hypothetical protein